MNLAMLFNPSVNMRGVCSNRTDIIKVSDEPVES